jgi:hypothetical protein
MIKDMRILPCGNDWHSRHKIPVIEIFVIEIPVIEASCPGRISPGTALSGAAPLIFCP